MKIVMTILVLAVSACAQNSPTSRSRAACGALGVSFDTVASAGQPPSKAEPGKALIYVVEDFPEGPQATGAPTIKIAADGHWVGATRGGSYLFFTADPGEHHLCINWQSHWQRFSKLVSFAHVLAEPGKTYYFRARMFFYSNAPMYLDLDVIDPDQGEYLVASSPLSTARPKK